jgi:Squalene-hopene cyclase C-terminal domain
MMWFDEVIAAGLSFLRQNLGTEAEGLWRDFTLTGVSVGSTECVSAFISAQIGIIPEGKMLAAGVVENIICHARETGGWGYREDVPEDCDSTAWVLLAAAASSVDLPRRVTERSTRFIVEHQHDNGGFITYMPAAKALLTPADQAGWFEPEISVTSSAVLALATTGYVGTENLQRAYLYISRSCRAGLWKSYWWNGFAYATYLSLLALSKEGRRGYEGHLVAAEQAILLRRSVTGGWANEQGMSDNGFSTSFALRALLLRDQILISREAITESLRYMSGLMTTTGGFCPSAEMLAPGGVKGSDVVLQDNGNITTACVVRAFHEARCKLRSN